MIKGLIFDHDGTLVDSEKLHYRCWQEIMEAFDVHFSLQEYVEKHNGIPTVTNAEILIRDYTLDIDAHTLSLQKQVLTQKRFKAQPSALMPFAEKVLKACVNDGFSLAIATGAGQKEIQQTFDAHPIGEYFSTVATRDDVKRPKPSPDVYQLAQKNLGLPAQQCLALEDTQAGIQSAKASGIFCIAVRNDYTRNADLSSADYICDNLHQAYEFIVSGSKMISE
ncbi:HAD family hydrolase [Ningiella sp. W23]|uniref:HAD family hydrolase n=1 Tax=Ningiella sp. W23 TaxID=3023715 RepID=UPI00375827DE